MISPKNYNRNLNKKERRNWRSLKHMYKGHESMLQNRNNLLRNAQTGDKDIKEDTPIQTVQFNSNTCNSGNKQDSTTISSQTSCPFRESHSTSTTRLELSWTDHQHFYRRVTRKTAQSAKYEILKIFITILWKGLGYILGLNNTFKLSKRKISSWFWGDNLGPKSPNLHDPYICDSLSENKKKK